LASRPREFSRSRLLSRLRSRAACAECVCARACRRESMMIRVRKRDTMSDYLMVLFMDAENRKKIGVKEVRK
jgi:hypothetical protein